MKVQCRQVSVICELVSVKQRVLSACVRIRVCASREAERQGDTAPARESEPWLIWDEGEEGNEWVMGTNTKEKETSTQIIILIRFAMLYVYTLKLF